jgi:urease accessory protein UreE
MKCRQHHFFDNKHTHAPADEKVAHLLITRVYIVARMLSDATVKVTRTSLTFATLKIARRAAKKEKSGRVVRI